MIPVSLVSGKERVEKAKRREKNKMVVKLGKGWLEMMNMAGVEGF